MRCMQLEQEGTRFLTEFFFHFFFAGTIFCFLNLMRREGPQQYIWEEMKAVSEMEFRFQDKIDAVDYGQCFKFFLNLFIISQLFIFACRFVLLISRGFVTELAFLQTGGYHDG